MMRQEVKFWTVHVFYVLFVLFLINRIFFSSQGVTERTISYVLYPFFKIHTSVVSSVHEKSQHRQNVQALQKELDSLYVQYDVLKGRVAQLEAQQIFVQKSQEVVDFAHRYEVENKKIAKVLVCYESLQEDAIFIEGGVDKGFAKDDVVVYQNALIGRIIEVYSWYSKVALITDQRCKVSAQASQDAAGICCGKNNKRLEFCFVPHFKKVSVGDIVISTGQGLMYPQGFAVGIVQSVKTDLVSHQIELKPYFDSKNVPYMYVFTKQNGN